MHTALQRTLVAALATWLSFLSGCESTGANKQVPRGSVSANEAARAAAILETQEPGRVSGPGTGRSMLPLYGSSSYIVVDPVDFFDLKRGMVVAYRNHMGRNVAHRLVSKENFYWRVEGINNERIDSERVTPENLIGVVYATFHGAE